MAPGAALEEGLEELVNSGVCLGLHVVLNSEWNSVKWTPCADRKLIPSLLDAEGEFTQSPMVLFENGFDVDEALIEVVCQYQKLSNLGVKLSYLDEHMGVGWLPTLRSALHTFARENGLNTVDHLPSITMPPQSVWTKEKFVNSLQGDGVLQVSHPAYRDPITEGFWHQGLEVGQIAAEREVEAKFFSDPEIVDAVLKAGFVPTEFTQLRSYF